MVRVRNPPSISDKHATSYCLVIFLWPHNPGLEVQVMWREWKIQWLHCICVHISHSYFTHHSCFCILPRSISFIRCDSTVSAHCVHVFSSFGNNQQTKIMFFTVHLCINTLSVFHKWGYFLYLIPLWWGKKKYFRADGPSFHCDKASHK